MLGVLGISDDDDVFQAPLRLLSLLLLLCAPQQQAQGAGIFSASVLDQDCSDPQPLL